MTSEIFLLQNPWRNNVNYSFNFKRRDILKTIINNLDNELALGLLGSRQVGKSSIIYLLIEHLLKTNTSRENIFYFNLDNFRLHSLFSNITDFIQFIGSDSEKKYVFIDEIQRLNSPGLFLKEVSDLKRNIKIIYSGSSQLEVKAKTKEHLVGRARTFVINRLSFSEYLDFAKPITKKDALSNILLYGSYPAVAKEPSLIEKKLIIQDIFNSYIQKDLVDFIKIKDLDKFNKFLVRIALQSGNLLNIHTISNSLSLYRVRAEEFINILEQTFICKRVYPFHRNYSKEIVKTPKIFYLDLGLRNFILNNFNDLDSREDTGNLFESFYYSELLASDHYGLKKINFWRTTNKTEIDFIVQDSNSLDAIEVKWNKKNRPRSFNTIESLFPNIKTHVITKEDFL